MGVYQYFDPCIYFTEEEFETYKIAEKLKTLSAEKLSPSDCPDVPAGYVVYLSGLSADYDLSFSSRVQFNTVNLEWVYCPFKVEHGVQIFSEVRKPFNKEDQLKLQELTSFGTEVLGVEPDIRVVVYNFCSVDNSSSWSLEPIYDELVV